MNARTEHLGKWELGVVVLCAAFVLLTLGAVGEGGRRRAKEAVCQANLHQWFGHFENYIKANDGKFYSGCNDQGYWWPLQLPAELQDWKANRTWLCPMAAIPTIDSHGILSPTLNIFNAWGIYTTPKSITWRGQMYTMNGNGLAGSYGLNGYVIPIPDGTDGRHAPSMVFEGGVPARNGWRRPLEAPHGNTVPMFLDALRFELWPRETQAPAADEFVAWGMNHMARACINRHKGTVNGLFVDGSVRKVGLKELWTLKWHQEFNTAGPWTKAGGVLPGDWPQWMSSFKEY